MNLSNSKGGWSPNLSLIGMLRSSIKVMINLFRGAPRVLFAFLDNLEVNIDRNLFDDVSALN